MVSNALVILVSILGIYAMYVFLVYKNYNDKEINK
jgi:hypothetical protein